MRRFAKWMAVFPVAALVASAALSQAGPALEWVSTGGPVGGLGYDVRIDPRSSSRMFVTDNNAGVIRSSDAGRTWRPSNAGITVKGGPTGDAFTIFSLTIDPADPDVIWAGTNGDNQAFGVFRSADGGATWASRSSGISDAGYGIVFRGFTVEPGNSSVVYAQAELPSAVHGREFNRVQGVVYRTSDGGASWSQVWLGDNLARYLIVHPQDPATLYLSTGIFDREAANSDCAAGVSGAGGVGVLKSSDGGAHWSPINAGLTDLYVGSLKMHPLNPLVLLAATGNNACSGAYDGNIVSGLFRTVDGGASWSKVIAGDIMTALAFSPSDPAVVYAGSASAFYRSADGGTSWTRHAKPSNAEWGPAGVRAGVPIDAVVDPVNPDLLYANNYGGGVFRSSDGARTWSIWSQGYSGADVHAAVVADPSGASVLAIGRSGPFRSPNFGLDWIGIGNGAANFAEWYSVAVRPGNPDVILVADEHQGVILRSADGGGDFVEVLRNPGANAADPTRREGFKALAFAPSDGSVVYAGLAKDRGTIDAMAPFGNVLYRSLDGGATFQVPSTALDGLNVYRLLVDRVDARTVWAATSGGLYRSTDGASSWNPVFGTGASPRVISAVAVEGASLVVGEKNVGIWTSPDGGASWPGGPHNTGFSNPNPAVLSLAFDPAGGGRIYAGDFYSGVYLSSDGGQTWAPFPGAGMTGLAVRAVKDLAVAGGVLYAATQGGGVFRLGGPALVPSPVQAALPTTAVGSTSAPTTFTVHNTASAARSLLQKSFGGAHPSDFAIAADGCAAPSTLAGAASCTFEVVFAPSAPGARSATLLIGSDDPSPYSIPLGGTALAAVSISPASAAVGPRGSLQFSASGGSGSGYVWSLASSVSGGGIDPASGAYAAGPSGGATDVVRVVDSLGNAATATVTVTAPAAPPGGSKGGGCTSGGEPGAALLLLLLLVGLRARTERTIRRRLAVAAAERLAVVKAVC